MVAQATIIAVCVLAIHYSMLEGEIFHGVARVLAKLPAKFHPPLFECQICMTPWYGSVIYVLFWGVNWQWPLTVICAMGINVAITKWLSPPKDE